MMRSYLFLLICLASLAPARADADVPQVVAGLRDRGQFQQAAEYAVREQQRDDLSERDRANLAIQLALVYTHWALAAPANTQADLWTRADTACTRFLERWPDNPYRYLVQTQQALVSMARGEQARSAGQLETARDQFRSALRQLTSIADAVNENLIAQRLKPGDAHPSEAFSVGEMESLVANLAYQAARCQRKLGLTYPPHTADRDDALLQASQRLTPLARRVPADELIWNARVELATCLRELGRSSTAQRLIDSWLKENPPADIQSRIGARDVPQAVHHADNSDGFAAAMADAAEARATGRSAEAAERYRRLATARPEQEEAARAHQLAILCMADVLRESPPEEHAAFATTYETLLKEHLTHWPTAATADEVRLWLAQLYTAGENWTAAIDALQPIAAISTSAPDAIALAVRCYEQQLGALDSGSLDERQRTSIIAAATKFLQPVVTGAENRWPDPWSDLQRQVALELARLHLRYSEQTSLYAERLLTAALQGGPANGNADTRKWQSQCRLLLIEALVRNGKAAEAVAVASQLQEAPATDVLSTLNRMDAETRAGTNDSSTASRHAALVQSLVRLAERNRNELTAAQSAQLDSYRASAIAAGGNREAALAQYAALAVQHPDDGAIQEQYASLLSQSTSTTEIRSALDRWLEVETRSRRGSDRWRRARRARIDLLHKIGQQEEAAKLDRLTRLLYPDWNAESSE